MKKPVQMTMPMHLTIPAGRHRIQSYVARGAVRAVACLAGAFTLLCPEPSRALDGSWNITGNNGNWATGSNWTNNQVADGTDFTAYFINNITVDRNVVVDAGRTIGNLIISDPSGSQNRTFNGGPLILSSTGLKPQIRVTAGATLTTFNVEIQGTSGLRKEQANAILFNAANTYSGGTEINRGILRLGNANGIPSGAGKGDVYMNSVGGAPTLDVGTVNPIINGLNSSTATALINSSGGAGTSILTLGAGDGSGEFGGVIADGANRKLGLTKTGAGTQILTNLNTYTGPTVVNGGVLKLNGDGSLSTSSGITLAAGGALDVTGLTTLPYTVNPGQSLNGGGNGVIQGDVNLSSGAGLGFTYSKGTTSLNVTSGTLTLNGNEVTVNVAGSAPLLNGSYKLIGVSGGGAVTGTIGTVTIGGLGIAGGGTSQVNLIGNELYLEITGSAPGVEWGSGDGTWADNVAGWESGGTSVFTNGNVALFTDTYSTGNPTVTLNTEVLPQSVVVSSTNNYTITGSGDIGGAAGLIKLGSGTLTLDIANTHTGGVALHDGTLNIKNANALGNAAGTLRILGGAFDNTSGGPLTLPDHPQIWGSALNFGGSSDLNLGAGPVTMTSGCTFTVNATAKLTVGGDISGAGFGFVKSGTGTLELNGNNSMTASSTISLGEVILGNDGALNGANGLSLVFPTDTNSKILSLNGHNITIRSLLMGIIAGGTATVVRNNHPSTPATLTVNPNAAAQYAGTITDGDAAPLSLIKDGTQNWTFGGGGVGAGTYSGDTTILAGTLTAGANNILPYGPGKGNLIVQAGATFDILDRSAISLNGLSGGGTVNRSNPGGSLNSTLTLGNNDANGNFSGRIRTTGNNATLNVIKTGTGTQILAGANDYTGTTTVEAGILQIGDGGASGSLTSASLVNNSVLIFNRDGNMNYAGDISGGGAVTNLGPGIVTLAGVNSYTGPTIVSGGTLRINGSLAPESEVTVKAGGALGGTGTILGPVTVEANGTLAPGASVGTLTVNNSVTLQGSTVMEVSRDTGTAESDLLAGVTTLNYGGALVVTNIGLTSLRAGDSFNLFDATTLNPGFTSITLPALLPGLSWTTNLNSDGSISISGSVIPPQLNAPAIDGTNLTLSGSGGVAGGTYYVLTSPDITAPVETWTPATTNVFDASGNFSFQEAVDPEVPQRFYMIAVP